jgi:hypothetical protein
MAKVLPLLLKCQNVIKIFSSEFTDTFITQYVFLRETN